MIVGRAAMWRAMQIYLYDWRRLRRRASIYANLNHPPVEVVQKNKELSRHEPRKTSRESLHDN